MLTVVRSRPQGKLHVSKPTPLPLASLDLAAGQHPPAAQVLTYITYKDLYVCVCVCVVVCVCVYAPSLYR